MVPEGKRVSELERLRTPPVKTTGTAMVRTMERVEEISAFALGRVNLSQERVLPPLRRLAMPPDNAPAVWLCAFDHAARRLAQLGVEDLADDPAHWQVVIDPAAQTDRAVFPPALIGHADRVFAHSP
ncbi:hypothetical protein [Streptomyces sp. NPDC004721]